MEKTDNIRYNKDDGKFYSSNPNEKTPYKKIKNMEMEDMLVK